MSEANSNAAVDHGAVLVYDGAAAAGVGQVRVADLLLLRTPTTAPGSLGIVTDRGERPSDLTVEQTRVVEGPPAGFWTNVPGLECQHVVTMDFPCR